jgi:hypothetical protein
MKQESNFVRVGLHVLSLSEIGDSHWERDTLFIHFSNGRFLSFKGQDARVVWDAITALAIDLRPLTPAERL